MRRKYFNLIISAIAITSLLLSTLPTATISAATEEEIEDSIVLGLRWLANNQNPNGSWGTSEEVGHTGLAVLKFLDRARELKVNPFSEAYEYSYTVRTGMDYLFLNAHIMEISPQPAGDPDTDGDGVGVYFGSNEYSRCYSTGISLMAIASADQNRIVGAIGSAVDGWTYGEAVQDAVDYLAFAQNEAGNARGGWGYYENFNDWSDNSNSGYVTLGLGYAERAGTTVPQFVHDELDIWINYIQTDVTGSPNDGGSGYTNPGDWVNMLKTGNLLYQMALLGDTVESQRVKDAIAYQERHWNDPNTDPGWKDLDTPHYQAMFCIMKGFEVFMIEKINVGGDIDWFNEVSTAITSTQNPDGSWPNDVWGDNYLSTTWALLTLERVVAIPQIRVYIDIKPGSWPNPINVGSKGVISVAICGTEEFDVETINPTTVTLCIEGVEECVHALRWSYEDAATPWMGDPFMGHALGGDGYVDLVLKFDTQTIVATLHLGDHVGSTVALQVRGNLLDDNGGTPIAGEDYVRVQAPNRK